MGSSFFLPDTCKRWRERRRKRKKNVIVKSRVSMNVTHINQTYQIEDLICSLNCFHYSHATLDRAVARRWCVSVVDKVRTRTTGLIRHFRQKNPTRAWFRSAGQAISSQCPTKHRTPGDDSSQYSKLYCKPGDDRGVVDDHQVLSPFFPETTIVRPKSPL